MLIEEIDGIALEPLERCFGDLLDVVRPTIQPTPPAAIIRIRLPPELRRDYDISARRSECFTYQFFIQERAVYLGSIEERDTSLYRGTEKRNHLLLVSWRSVGPTHSHAAEPNGRYFQIAVSKLAFLHGFLPILFADIEDWSRSIRQFKR